MYLLFCYSWHNFDWVNSGGIHCLKNTIVKKNFFKQTFLLTQQENPAKYSSKIQIPIDQRSKLRSIGRKHLCGSNEVCQCSAKPSRISFALTLQNHFYLQLFLVAMLCHRHDTAPFCFLILQQCPCLLSLAVALSTSLQADWISCRFDIQFRACNCVRGVTRVIPRVFEVLKLSRQAE